MTLAFRNLSSTDKLFTRIYATQLPEGLADKSEKTSFAKKKEENVNDADIKDSHTNWSNTDVFISDKHLIRNH